MDLRQVDLWDSCPICLNVFNDSRVLPCGHCFCLSCLHCTLVRAVPLSSPSLDLSSIDPSSLDPSSIDPSNVVMIRCPLCRSGVQLSHEDLNALPPRADLSLDRRGRVDGGIHADVDADDQLFACSTAACNNPPVWFCGDGCRLLCEVCVRLHGRMRLTSSHRVSTYNKNDSCVSLETLFCSKHPLLTADYCCNTCNSGPHCSTCILQSHRMHETISVEDGKLQFQKELQAKVLHLQAEIPRLTEQYEQLLSHVERLEDSAEETIRAITSKAEYYIQQIELYRDAAIEKARQLHSQETKQVELEMTDLTDVLKYLRHGLSLASDYKSQNSLEKPSSSSSSSRLLFARSYLDGCLTRCNERKPHEPRVVSFTESWQLNLSSNTTGSVTPPPTLGIVHLKKQNITSSSKLQRSHSDITAIRQQVGQRGVGWLEFDHAWGISTDPATGNIYVADQFNHRIQVLTPDLKFVSSFGSRGSGPTEFNNPISVCVSPDSTFLVVTDNGNHRLAVYTLQGELLGLITSHPQGELQLRNPINVAIAAETGEIFVADTRAERIQVVHRDGQFVRAFGQRGSGLAEVGAAEAIAITQAQEVCVLARGGANVQIFDLAGNYLRSLDISPVSGRTSMICGAHDTLWISDSDASQILVYASTGNQLAQIGADGTLHGAFSHQMGIAFGLDGAFYVSDYGNNRIVVL